MQWSDAIQEYVGALKPVAIDSALIKRMLSLVDLTSLNANDTESSITTLFQKARTPFGHVAAVCVYSQFVPLAAAEFVATPIKVATVVNFPEGGTSLDSVLSEINHAVHVGATEIDVVFPYERYLAGEAQYARQFVAACKAACGADVLLKVILETGALADPVIIADASLDALTAGADFIKTSTGKLSPGATLEAAAAILLVMRHAMPILHREVGIKISGGVRNLEQAAQYMELADNIMGRDWVSPETFRFGASKLVDEMWKDMGL